jgi:hypothetical protein
MDPTNQILTYSRKQMICKSQELINNELRSASFYSSNFYTIIIYNMYVEKILKTRNVDPAKCKIIININIKKEKKKIAKKNKIFFTFAAYWALGWDSRAERHRRIAEEGEEGAVGASPGSNLERERERERASSDRERERVGEGECRQEKVREQGAGRRRV